MPASKININGSIDINGNTTIFNVECSVNANPPASIIWFNVSSEEVQELINTSSTYITHQFTSDMAPISLSTLVISITESSDYMCVANNTIGDAVPLNFSLAKMGQCNCIRTYKGNECREEGMSVFSSMLIQIKMNSTACIVITIGKSIVLVFITKPQNQTAVDGNMVEFQCSACSTLDSTIMWTFTRKGSMQFELINENSTSVGDLSIIPGKDSSSLMINRVNWTYEGVYECIISTQNDQIQAEASLKVLSKLKLFLIFI